MDAKGYTIKARYLVRGPNRPKFPHYYCAGRGWTKDWVEVGVVAGTEDPVEEYDDKSTGVVVKRKRPILHLINESQLAEILRDADDRTGVGGNMSVRTVDAGTGEAKDLKINVLGLMQENTDLKAANAKLSGEVDRLRLKLAEADKLLEETTKPAAELAQKVAARRKVA